MASEQAEAVNRMYRERRDSVAPAAETTLAERRAASELLGHGTAEPDGVTYDDVDAGGVSAQWVVPDGAVTDRVLIYVHGGGYSYCSMRSHSKLVGHLAKAAGCQGLNLDYRLAPEHPHPAAVTDAVAANRWLLEQGIQPQHVAAVGDSAGGGLAAALLVKSRDEGLPPPGAGVLMSPWVDLALTAESLVTRAETDVLSDVKGTQHCADQFLAGQDPRDPYASPFYADLEGLSPLYIQVGDAETLFDDSTRFADKAQRAGVDVRLDVFPEMQHVFQVWAGNMPEADDAIARIGAFLRPRLGLE